MGGGSGGSPDDGTYTNASGGDGVVFLRVLDDVASAGTITSASTTTTNVGGSGETVIKWTANGSFTVA